MGLIPADWLPATEDVAETIFPLPEVRLPRRLNLAEHGLDRHVAEGRGAKPALLYGDQVVTFAALRRDVNRLANGLRALGIEKNDRVIVRSANRPEFIASCYACWRIGAIPVLVNHMLKTDEIVYRGLDSAARAAIVDAESWDEMDKAQKEMKLEHVVVFGDCIPGTHAWDDLLAGSDDEIDGERTMADDIIRIIYSSGTTGRPKGIVTTTRDAVAIGEIATRYLLALRPDDVIGGHPSFTFAFGFGFVLFVGHVGCTLSIVDRFEPELMFRTAEAHRISVLCCVPTAFRMMLHVKDAERRYDLRALRLCQSAGEWLPGATVREWKQRFGTDMLDAVGSGDLNYWLATRPGTPDDKLDSSGQPLPGIECKIVDEQGHEVAPGTEGELLVRAPWAQKYWRRRDKQREGVWNGWNRTGLIYVEDEDGYFWYKARNDEIIVTSGYKVAGGEVEAALLNHPAVLEAAVVAAPDAVRGSIVKAFVVLNDGWAPSPEFVEELKQFVKTRIEAYKYPREIEFAEGRVLPRTSTGKIQRFMLRDAERRQSSGS
jgi:2-aminobenzoate-CoA ligase